MHLCVIWAFLIIIQNWRVSFSLHIRYLAWKISPKKERKQPNRCELCGNDETSDRLSSFRVPLGGCETISIKCVCLDLIMDRIKPKVELPCQRNWRVQNSLSKWHWPRRVPLQFSSLLGSLRGRHDMNMKALQIQSAWIPSAPQKGEDKKAPGFAPDLKMTQCGLLHRNALPS